MYKPFPNQYLYLSTCLIISFSRWAQFAFAAENLKDLFRRDIKDWHYLTACHQNSWGNWYGVG